MSEITENEKKQIISTGTTLFIEGTRELSRPAGKNIPLTSWFYALQNSVKVAIQSGQIVLNNINMLGNIYDIKLYKLKSFQEYYGRRILNVANNADLDFELKNDRIISNVSRSDARKVFSNFLLNEYEYSITKNLENKNFDAHTEVMIWHLLNDIYNFPRPVGYEQKLSYDLINDLSKKSNTKTIWDQDKLQNAPILIDGWMKGLVETKKFDIVNIPDVGEMYSPPRFSDIDNRILFSGPHSEKCQDILEKAERSPSWPIQATKENNNACFHLTSAGLIEYISEKTSEIRNFGYIVSRKLFLDIDAKLGYLYQDKGYENNSDITLTEQIFRTVGRARLATNIFESIKYSDLDAQLTRLEDGEIPNSPTIYKILEPMLIKGSLEITKDTNNIFVVPGMENDVSLMLDIWAKMDMIDLNIPEEKYAHEKRAAQTRSQIRRKAYQWFRKI